MTSYDNGTMTVGAFELGYRLEGEGERRVVLLHGLNSHSGTWRKTFPSLVRGFSVFAPSLPSHAGPVSWELVDRYARYTTEMLGRLGIARASVVGNSIGGWVGMRLVSTRAFAVERLLLEDTAGATSREVERVCSARIPVTILWGERDRTVPVEDAYVLHSRLKGSRLSVIPGAGHVPHWEAPEEFGALLRGFLEN